MFHVYSYFFSLSVMIYRLLSRRCRRFAENIEKFSRRVRRNVTFDKSELNLNRVEFDNHKMCLFAASGHSKVDEIIFQQSFLACCAIPSPHMVSNFPLRDEIFKTH